MKQHDYIEKCPYCGQFLTAEQAEKHECNPPLIGVKEIPILYLSEVDKQNGDTIFLARGRDGILYRLRLNKNLIRRKFTGHDDRRRLDRTRNNKPYIHVGVIFARIKRVETKWRLTITKSIW